MRNFLAGKNKFRRTLMQRRAVCRMNNLCPPRERKCSVTGVAGVAARPTVRRFIPPGRASVDVA